MIREYMFGLLAGPADPTASLLDSAEPENEETSLWDPASQANNQPWITFLTRELFIQNLFHIINIIFSNDLLLLLSPKHF